IGSLVGRGIANCRRFRRANRHTMDSGRRGHARARWSRNPYSYRALEKDMSHSRAKRKTWEEKLNEAKDLPKVVHLKGKAKRRWHAATLAIASLREIFSLIQEVPRGRVATIADLQSAVARKHAAEIGCPLTTGIFAWIAANASEELEARQPG